jgi:hypothetical protein
MKHFIQNAHILGRKEKRDIKGGSNYPITVDGVYYPANCWVGNSPVRIIMLCGCLNTQSNVFTPGECGGSSCGGDDFTPHCLPYDE